LFSADHEDDREPAKHIRHDLASAHHGKLTDMHDIQYADMPKFTQARSAALIPLIISHDKIIGTP